MNYKIKMKDFFSEWAKNVGAYYTWQNMVILWVLSTRTSNHPSK